MRKDDFNSNIPGAEELSEQDLMLIQGGNIFGDALDWVKDKASDAVDAVKSAVTQPVQTLIKATVVVGDLFKWLSKRPPPPYPPYAR
jgi:hypothetical protein